MKQRKTLAVLFTCWLAAITSTQPLHAQTTDQELTTTILQQDSLFWITYNTCDTAGNKKFFTTSIEFYHDKGGLTLGAEKLSAALKNNLCSNKDYRLRREAVAGTVRVFPLRNADGIYGAILSGEHLFYVTEGGNAERLDGQARFTHVWILENNSWKMTRILSYDHRPPTVQNGRTAVKLPDAILQQWVGTYKGAKSGTIVVRKENENLLLQTNNSTFLLYPEAPNRFFMKERDLLFEFVQNKEHGDLKMLVRENGALAEEAVFVSRN